MLTFCHFLSLLITFYHFWTNFWEVSQACSVHTNASARHCDTAFKLFFYQNLCWTLQGVNAHFLSLSVTFDHFLSLLDQLLGGVTSMFCAHQCLCKPSCYVAPCWSIIVFTKTTEMGLVAGSDFSTMLSLLKSLPKSDWSRNSRNKWQRARPPMNYNSSRFS